MNVLAIDTASALCQVALLCGSELTAADAREPRAHADQVLPLVDRLLDARGIALAHIDRFAFGRGPGGLTGLRVAASVVQGFAYATERPAVAVSNLEALALNAATGGLVAARRDGVIVAHDARQQQVCWCAYTLADGWPQALHEERFERADALTLPAGDWLYCGTASTMLGRDARDVVAAEVTADLAANVAAAIARLAARPAAVVLEPAAAQPVYWRHPVDG